MNCSEIEYSTIDSLKININKLHSDNLEYRKMIENNKKKIYKIQKEMYSICEHEFIRDTTVTFDDMYKWKCSKCGYYKGMLI